MRSYSNITCRSPFQVPPVPAYRPIAAAFSSSVSTQIAAHPRSRPRRLSSSIRARATPRRRSSLDHADLVQEELRLLVRMEDLDRGDEARRSIVDVAEQQHVAVIGEEPRGLLRDDGVVESLLEPNDLAVVARPRTHDPNVAHARSLTSAR